MRSSRSLVSGNVKGRVSKGRLKIQTAIKYTRPRYRYLGSAFPGFVPPRTSRRKYSPPANKAHSSCRARFQFARRFHGGESRRVGRNRGEYIESRWDIIELANNALVPPRLILSPFISPIPEAVSEEAVLSRTWRHLRGNRSSSRPPTGDLRIREIVSPVNLNLGDATPSVLHTERRIIRSRPIDAEINSHCFEQ